MSEKKQIKPDVFKINLNKIPILNERPPEMSYEDYRLHRKLHQQMLKLHKQIGINGKLILPSASRRDMENTSEIPSTSEFTAEVSSGGSEVDNGGDDGGGGAS
jgi:hypothetical protein